MSVCQALDKAISYMEAMNRLYSVVISTLHLVEDSRRGVQRRSIAILAWYSGEGFYCLLAP